MTFSVIETVDNTYNVTVGNLTGVFVVSAKPQPMPTTLSLANMGSPLEAWPGQQVNVSVEATNKGNASISYLLPFFVNGAVAQSVQVQIVAGASENLTTVFSEASDGTYVISAGGQNAQFTIVTTGYYTLNYCSSYTGLPFTLDGVSEVRPFSGLVTVGQHTVTVPATAQIQEVSRGLVTWDFNSWGSGSTSLTQVINVQGETNLETSYA